MRPIYRHGDNAYIIVKQTLIQHFCKVIGEEPNMEYVQLYMQSLGCDHVLRNETHFMFCETIQDADIDDMELWDNTLLDGLEDDYDMEISN
jgi:hypothetical protein